MGNIALLSNRHTAHVRKQEIEDHSGSLGGAVPADAIDTLVNTGGYFDFEIHGMKQSGKSVLIVIPQHAAIPDNAVYRKYAEVSGWQDFIEDAKNSLASAPGEAGINPPEAGVCPPPGDPTFIAGLNPGHYCVQLMVEDGGPNDSDGRKNGVIADPGGVAVTTSGVVSTGGGGGGGGSGGIDLIALILLIGLYRRNLGIRRYGLYLISR